MGISVSYILISHPSNTAGSSEIRNPVDMVFYSILYKEFYTSKKVVLMAGCLKYQQSHQAKSPPDAVVLGVKPGEQCGC